MKYLVIVILFISSNLHGQKYYSTSLVESGNKLESLTLLNLSSTNKLIDSTIYYYDIQNRIISELHYDKNELTKEIDIKYQNDTLERITNVYRNGETINTLSLIHI